MKKIIFNLILAGVFMNFGYPILVDEWRDFQFKNSDMEALKNMSADELMNRFDFVLDKIDFENTDLKETTKSTQRQEHHPRAKPLQYKKLKDQKYLYLNKELRMQEKKILAESQKHIGLPYSYGSMDPAKGFDCSGFARFVYKESINVNLPRTSSSQFVADGGKLVEYKDLQPGDLMFFSHSEVEFNM